jgi:hypothetical protein
VEKVAKDCGVAPGRVTLILTPTKSLAGGTQIAARCLEVALHKAHALHFALDRIVDGWATAPLPPPAKDFPRRHGPHQRRDPLRRRRAHLFVRGDDAAAGALAEKPAQQRVARDYGKPFGETFQQYKGDFFAIDAMLFSPGRRDRDRAGVRPQLPCRGHRSGDDRPQLRRLTRHAGATRRHLRRPAGLAHAPPAPRLRDARRRRAAGGAVGLRLSPTEGAGIVIPGLGGALPDAAFVRTVANGSFEQVTHRLGILHALSAMGRRRRQRCARHRAFASTSRPPARSSIATNCRRRRPGRSRIARRPAPSLAREVAAGARDRRQAAVRVAGAAGLQRLASPDALPDADALAGLYYLQRLVSQAEGKWRDWRVFVVGDRAGGGDDPPRQAVDHQHAPGRQGRGSAGGRGGGRAGDSRRQGRGRAFMPAST